MCPYPHRMPKKNKTKKAKDKFYYVCLMFYKKKHFHFEK